MDSLEGNLDVIVSIKISGSLQTLVVEEVGQSFGGNPAQGNLIAPVPDSDVGTKIQKLPHDWLRPT